MSSKKARNHIIRCIYQRQIGLYSNSRDDLLKSFAEEKASLPNKNQPCEISGQTRATLLMEFSGDGKRIASTHGDHTIRVTDIRTGKCTHALNGHPRTPWCIAFHPSSNNILGSGCLGGEVRIWDLQGGGSEVWRCDSALSITSMTFHPSDNVVVFAASNKLHFWDWTRPEPFAVCATDHEFEKIRWVKFDRIGHRLLTAIANASDEGFSDGLRFSLFNEHPVHDGRYTRSGEGDNFPFHSNSAGAYQDSLMDLRTQLSETQNTFNRSRRLSNAQRYAHSVTDQAYRSSLESRLAFESDADRRRNASRHPSNFSASMRPSPLLLTASEDFGPSDWTSRERELEAGDALLSLATDGRQAPSGYVRGLDDDVARRQFLSIDDLISENLTPLEYVEATPSNGAYEDLLERTLAASSTGVRRLDEISGDATLNRLLWRDEVGTGRPTDLGRDDFPPAGEGRSSEDNLLDAQPGFVRAERDSGHSNDSLADTWLDSSFSASLSFYRDLTEAGGEPQGGLATPGESGLDLRIPVPEGSAGIVPEHCYAVPFGRLPLTSDAVEDGSATASAVSPLTPTSTPSGSRMSLDDDSQRAPADGESPRTAEGRTDDGSSARCRVFPRAGSASATVTSAVDVGASLSSFRIRRDARNQGSRFDDPRCDDSCTARSSDVVPAGGAERGDTNPARAFDTDEPQPSTSHGPASNQPGRPPGHEFQMSSFFQLPDVGLVRPESNGPASREDTHARERPSGSTRLLSRPRLFQFSDLFSGPDAPENRVSRAELYSDELDERTRSADERVSPAWNEPTRRSEPADYPPTRFSGLRFASTNERLRERRERTNFHVEGLRARFRSSSSTALGYSASGGGSDSRPEDSLYVYRGAGSSGGFSSGADPVGEPVGTQAREHMVRRLRMFRDEMRSYYTPNRSASSNRDSVFPREPNIQSLRVNAALNRAISGAFTTSGDGPIGSSVGDPTFRIQAWNFTRCEIPNLSDSESNILIGRAKIHNDANIDISQDGCFICAFTIPGRNFGGDIVLSVVSLRSENFGECLFTKNFGQNAISVSLSPCNNYVLVGLATKRFTWMFTPKQIVAQVYRLKTPQAGEDSTEHICDITHPCDTDFRAPISMNSARWLLGPGEGLAYGTNRGDLNICRPGFEQIDKPEVNDDLLSDSVPNRRNLMQMLGITMPRMTNSATQTSHGLRRSASTQTDQNSQSSSSAVATLDRGSQAASMDVEDLHQL